MGLDPDNWLGLTDEDVIASSSSKASIITLAAFLQVIISWASGIDRQWPTPNKAWFTEDGIPCEIMRTRGGGWQKGRFRFRLEFVPDNPDAFFNADDEPESGAE